MDTKPKLREHYREVLRSKSTATEESSKAVTKLHAKVQEFLGTMKPPFGGYRELPGEPPLKLFQDMTPSKWCYPRRTTSRSLTYHWPESWSKNSGGLWEPTATSATVDVSQISALLLPGLAFDRQGGRLGYGQGFFDRTLQSYQGLIIGIAWDEQIHSQALPLEPHDRRVNILITPSCLWDLRS